MDINQILLLAIVILGSIIVIFVVYFILNYFLNIKREKKIDSIFDPATLVEEESLMNVLDEKHNLDHNQTPRQDSFVAPHVEVKLASQEAVSREQKVNPFGIDLSSNKDDQPAPSIEDSQNNQNKFLK